MKHQMLLLSDIDACSKWYVGHIGNRPWHKGSRRADAGRFVGIHFVFFWSISILVNLSQWGNVTKEWIIRK